MSPSPPCGGTETLIDKTLPAFGIGAVRCVSQMASIARAAVRPVRALRSAPGDPRTQVFARQCQSAGSPFSFSIRGGEAEALRMLDALQVMKLAVSLDGTETLIPHPASTTHSGVPRQTRDRMGVKDFSDS